MSHSWPDPDELADLFRRVCAGDRPAIADFISAALDPLAADLRRRHPEADEHARLTAAEDAVLALVRNPSIYDPARGTLIAFLRLSAEGDLRNARNREARYHRGRESGDSVELAPDRRNTPAEDLADDLPSFDDPDLAAEIAAFSPVERAVFELMLAGERATAAYAPVLGVGHLPADEQAREVKRAKDRLLKRLQRARGVS